jgi:hypothetical protein
MSTDPSGTNDLASGNDQDTVKYETFSKLLGEKKKLQSEFSEMKAKIDLIEQEKLAAEGKWRELAEARQKEAADFKAKNLSMIKTVSEKTIRSQFVREAEKLGCLDADMALKACSFDDLEITEDFEFDPKKLQTKIQELTKTKPYLFKSDVKVPNNLNPNNGGGSSKPLSDLTDSELKQLLATTLKK